MALAPAMTTLTSSRPLMGRVSAVASSVTSSLNAAANASGVFAANALVHGWGSTPAAVLSVPPVPAEGWDVRTVLGPFVMCPALVAPRDVARRRRPCLVRAPGTQQARQPSCPVAAADRTIGPTLQSRPRRRAPSRSLSDRGNYSSGVSFEA